MAERTPSLGRRILVGAGLVVAFAAGLILLTRYALARRVDQVRSRR